MRWTIEAMMAHLQHLYVFAYDVARDSARAKVHDVLSEKLVRIQRSVFEGRMTAAQASRLAARIGNYLEETDSLRVWAVTADGLPLCLAKGGTPVAEAQPFFLF
jgi:CRISPR-associated protein Cas2